MRSVLFSIATLSRCVPSIASRKKIVAHTHIISKPLDFSARASSSSSSSFSPSACSVRLKASSCCARECHPPVHAYTPSNDRERFPDVCSHRYMCFAHGGRTLEALPRLYQALSTVVVKTAQANMAPPLLIHTHTPAARAHAHAHAHSHAHAHAHTHTQAPSCDY